MDCDSLVVKKRVSLLSTVLNNYRGRRPQLGRGILVVSQKYVRFHVFENDSCSFKGRKMATQELGIPRLGILIGQALAVNDCFQTLQNAIPQGNQMEQLQYI